MLVWSTHWHAKDTPANWIALERALPASSKASFSKNRPPSANKISRVPQLRREKRPLRPNGGPFFSPQGLGPWLRPPRCPKPATERPDACPLQETPQSGIKWVGRHNTASNSSVGRDFQDKPNPVMEPGLPESQEAFHTPSPTEIWAAVDQIRESRTMRGCLKLMRLLAFVVEATLQGEAEYLKETTIGVFVFGRKPVYDPKIDTIVRSQAWRLRAKLKKYYATEGAQDTVVISLPRGHYIPVFQKRPAINY